MPFPHFYAVALNSNLSSNLHAVAKAMGFALSEKKGPSIRVSNGEKKRKRARKSLSVAGRVVVDVTATLRGVLAKQFLPFSI